jgi:hypothetical protein
MTVTAIWGVGRSPNYRPHSMNGVACMLWLEEIQGRYRIASASMERQDLSCTYLAHHELESVLIISIVIKSQKLP